ncbi:MAG: arginine--tRNA ligase, partial [Mycoplasmataceae bacterium]|nr:arginine--tRNA ligase [Mycoplasmataceae bacterium]
MLKRYETVIELIKKEILTVISKQNELINDFGVQLAKVKVQVELTKNPILGDFSTNVMMSLGLSQENVMKFAQKIADALPKCYFEKINVATPGFLNIFLAKDLNSQLLKQILKEQNDFGQFKRKKIFYNIEFISANPTGLLHIGHARNAAIGDSLSRIWQTYGIDINREYYINDGGNQIEKLGMSVLVRYKQALGLKDELPEDSYHGLEIIEIANKIKNEIGDKYIDAAYNVNKILDSSINDFFKTYATNFLLNNIKQTLNHFDVTMDIWFSEFSIYANKLIDTTLAIMKRHIYQKDGATWLKTTELGDDKDRVLVKSDGVYTYFLPDIAYHNIKLSRGYDKIFNIWGSDHKSYADRMKIAIQLLGYSKDKVEILIMQMVRLVKNGAEFKMSKRSGNSLTLQDLLNTIGKDAARWYLVSQSLSTHLEIDVDKATKHSNDNPLYYVQYAHARIHQLLDKTHYDIPSTFNLLNSPTERHLINLLHYFKHTIQTIARNYETHKMTLYLTNLAKSFHVFYANNKI